MIQTHNKNVNIKILNHDIEIWTDQLRYKKLSWRGQEKQEKSIISHLRKTKKNILNEWASNSNFLQEHYQLQTCFNIEGVIQEENRQKLQVLWIDESSIYIEKASNLKYQTKKIEIFKVLAFTIYILRKLKNNFKMLSLFYTFRKSLKKTRCLFFNYIPEKIKVLKKGACFLFTCFENIQNF